jgi:hypothetical protein
MCPATKRWLVACVLAVVTVACSSSDRDRDTSREKYCYTARLDFERVIRTAGDPATKASARASARSILALFANNGEEWVKNSPRRLAHDSRLILDAAQAAAGGQPVMLADADLTTAFESVGEYADRCQ